MAFTKRQKEEAKPRQEAVVKTITPAQPAPVVERPQPVKAEARPPPLRPPAPVAQRPAEQGFFAKLRNFFFGDTGPDDAARPGSGAGQAGRAGGKHRTRRPQRPWPAQCPRRPQRRRQGP